MDSMFSKKEFLKEEKDCTDMLGMSLEEYREYVNNTKVPTKKDNQGKRKYDNSILTKLGLSSSDLKNRKVL